MATSRKQIPQRTENTVNVATINICGIKDKEIQIVEFMKKRNIQIMGIADTRTKGNNSKEIHENYVLMDSGVDNTQRATHGVGFVLHPEKAKHIVETK